MIYLFHGDDGDKARGKWRRVGESFRAKYPDGNIFRFNSEEFNLGQFEELVVSQDLLGGKRLVLTDRLLENPEARAFFEAKLGELAASATVFAFLELSLPPALLGKVERAGGKVEEFVAKSRALNKTDFNLFALCDALGERDRRQLWVLMQQALGLGLVAEEVFWKLVWQTKTMLLVAKSGGRPLKTLKPYTAGRAARFVRNYRLTELEKLSGDLVALWHDSKREDGPDFTIGLERFILSI